MGNTSSEKYLIKKVQQKKKHSKQFEENQFTDWKKNRKRVLQEKSDNETTLGKNSEIRKSDRKQSLSK